MDLMSMLPLLMVFNGGSNTANKQNNGGMDMQSVLKLMSLLNGNSKATNPMDMFKNAFGGNNQTSRTSAEREHANPNMQGISGMLSPDMIKLLMNLATKK